MFSEACLSNLALVSMRWRFEACRLLFRKGVFSRIDFMVSLSSRMCSFCLITLNNSGFGGLNVDTKGII